MHTQQWTHTHTHREHTTGAVGSHLCCDARAAVGGSVPCSRAPQSWYWRWKRALYIHSPHLQFLLAWDSNPQPLGYESNFLTIRPRLPLFNVMHEKKCIKSNQIKSLLLSHHHSTSALVSEILMSVLQTAQKKPTTIYIWTDSAKKNNKQLHMDRQCKKTALEHLQCSRQCKKKNNNLHMDSAYLQTVQKTMCKIHIHILSTHSVL